MPKRQQPGTSPRRLVPVFIDAGRIGDVKNVLHQLGIEAFSTADGHREDVDHPVPRLPDLERQDGASLYGCSIDQYTYDEHTLTTNQSSDFEDLTSALSRLSMSTNSPHGDSYPARSAPALFSGSSPLVTVLKKKYYVVIVGKCAGIFYDEWYAYPILSLLSVR